MKTKTGVIGLLLTVAVAAVAEMRTWTFEKSGKTIEAEVVGVSGNVVTLKRADGKIYSLPVAYLTASNRIVLAAERAKKWKEVEVVKLEGAASGGRYKRCAVQSADVTGDILIDLLPASVEAILNNRNQRAVRIDQLKSRIENMIQARGLADTPVNDSNTNRIYDPNSALVYALDPVRVRIEEARASLAKLQAAYDEYANQTKAARVLKMKNTGLVYQGLPVWECFDPRKKQQ